MIDMARHAWSRNRMMDPDHIVFPENDPAGDETAVRRCMTYLNEPAKVPGPKVMAFILQPHLDHARERSLLDSLSEAGELTIETLVRSNGSKAYLVDDQPGFGRVLPEVFRLGPPEITLIAAPAAEFARYADDAKADAVLRFAEKGGLRMSMMGWAGLHFDSGVLMEAF